MTEPIDAKYREKMNELAAFLDARFNGEAKDVERTVGFVLLIFPFEDEKTRTNYISNANRKDIVASLKEIVARFEGQPEIKGNA